MPIETAVEKEGDFCYECGEAVGEGDSPGVLYHLDEDGGIDYDLDRAHVPLLASEMEESINLLND